MKIGVLTFHHSENFGAVLQALALQSLLISWGHEVVILNHAIHCSPLWSRWRDARGKLANPLERVRGLLHQHRYRAEFARFRKKSLRLTNFLPDSRSLSEAARDFNMILTGSDQVWHFAREPRYFLHWNPPFPGKKVSYAASCGSDIQPEASREKIGSWIRSFDFISVRDDFRRDSSSRLPDASLKSSPIPPFWSARIPGSKSLPGSRENIF